MIARLYYEGDLVSYTEDLQPRIYRVKGNPIFQYNDWWYHFHHTGQGSMNKSEPKLPQAKLLKVNTKGQIFGT